MNDVCPYMNEKVCGLRTGRPVFRSYHIEEDQKQRDECYLQHVILCCKEWEEKKKVFVGPIINRVLSISFESNEIPPEVSRELSADLEIGLRIVVVHHDIGKLSKEYQDGKWYRHEVVGAHLVYDMLSMHLTDEKLYGKLLRALLSATVYLHHEAIQLARNWSGLRSPTFEYLIDKIGSLSFTFKEEAHCFFECANKIGGLNMKYRLSEKIEGRKIVSTIGNVVSLLDGMPRVNAARLCLASMLLLVNEIDNRAAEQGRSI